MSFRLTFVISQHLATWIISLMGCGLASKLLCMLSLITEEFTLILFQLLNAQSLIMHCSAEDSFSSILSDDEIINTRLNSLRRECDSWHDFERLWSVCLIQDLVYSRVPKRL